MPVETPAANAPVESPLRRAAGAIVEILLLLILSGVAWHAVNYATGLHPDADSGIYSACAQHLKAGKALYREVWEHKVPGVYLLDWAALALGDGTMRAIHQMERLFAVAAALLLYLVVRLAFANPALAFVIALLLPLHLYHPNIHQGGNLTEEYAVVFVLAGIGAVLLAQRAGRRPGALLIAGAGLCFGLATLTKEPFLFSSVAWFALAVAAPGLGARARCARGACFLLGALVPVVLLGGWLAWRGAFGNWMDVFSYNAHYSALQQREGPFETIRLSLLSASSNLLAVMTVTRVLFLFGLVSLFSRPFRERTGSLPVFAALAFVMELAGTMVSTLRIPHYYMQMAPSFLLVAGCGAGFLAFSFERQRVAKPAVALAIVAAVLFFDGRACADFVTRLKAPWTRVPPSPLAVYISAHSTPQDTIWAGSGYNARLYVETGRNAPSRWFYLFDWTFLDTRGSTAKEKARRLAAELQANPPRFIVGNTSTADYLRDIGLGEWLVDTYTIADPREGPMFLYERAEGAALDRRRAAHQRQELAALLAVRKPPELARLDAALDRIVALSVAGRPLEEAVSLVARAADFPVLFTAAAEAFRARPVSLTSAERSASRTLEALLDPLGLDYEPAADGIRIVAHDAADRPPRRQSFCVDFDGRRGAVIIPWSPALDIRGALTVEAWVWYRGPGGVPVALVSRDCPAPGPFELGLGPTGRLWANVSWGNWASQPANLLFPEMPRNRWTHVALVFDQRRLRLFLDGRPAVDYELATTLAATRNPLSIGRKPSNGATVNARIDEVRLSNVARYTGAFVPAARFEPDADTVALYHFDVGSGAVAHDSGGQDLHGEIRDAAWSAK